MTHPARTVPDTVRAFDSDAETTEHQGERHGDKKKIDRGSDEAADAHMVESYIVQAGRNSCWDCRAIHKATCTSPKMFRL